MSAALVYRGVDLFAAARTLLRRGGSLRAYATATPELAARYANARATGQVRAEFAPLARGGALLVYQLSSAPPCWGGHGDVTAAASSLDAVEAWIDDPAARLVAVRWCRGPGPDSSCGHEEPRLDPRRVGCWACAHRVLRAAAPQAEEV